MGKSPSGALRSESFNRKLGGGGKSNLVVVLKFLDVERKG